MLEWLEQIDTTLFLWFNSFHSQVFDKLMFYSSNKYTFIPLYLFILVFLYLKFGLKYGLFILITVVIAVTIADRVTAGFFKPFFERLRPCHHPELKKLVHVVDGACGGKYGFASSHAANSIAVFLVIKFIVGRSFKFLVLMLFIWALLQAYSRIYLGVHYPGDIVMGWLIGWGSAWVSTFVMSKFRSFFS